MTDTPGRIHGCDSAVSFARPARDLLSVHYANTPVWRWLKSGSLVFLGLFLWMSGNVLLAYWTDSVTVRYALAYGFVLILWGPLTHLLVVPAVIRLRRTAENPTVRRIVRHGSKINFATFPRDRRGRGTLAPGVMLLDFVGLRNRRRRRDRGTRLPD